MKTKKLDWMRSAVKYVINFVAIIAVFVVAPIFVFETIKVMEENAKIREDTAKKWEQVLEIHKQIRDINKKQEKIAKARASGNWEEVWDIYEESADEREEVSETVDRINRR